MWTDELSIALRIWNIHNDVVNNNVKEIHEALVFSYTKNSCLTEIKNYFLRETIHQLSYKQVDRLLTSIEERFNQNIDEDAASNYLVTNINPIKTACHMLMLLNMIKSRYSVAGLRTEHLSEIILQTA